MRIAVTYEDGKDLSAFWTYKSSFKLYDIEDGKITSTQIVETRMDKDMEPYQVSYPQGEVDVLICGGIGGGAQIGT